MKEKESAFFAIPKYLENFRDPKKERLIMIGILQETLSKTIRGRGFRASAQSIVPMMNEALEAIGEPKLSLEEVNLVTISLLRLCDSVSKLMNK